MDDKLFWTWLFVGLTFALYIFIAWITRVRSTKGFYVAGGGIPAFANGMATGADWMSAASFLGMAGLISFKGYDGSAYLIGWTGGYVLLAMLLAPYLRKFGKFTVPDFVGDRYYSNVARVVAVICAIFVSITYVAGQMRGVGIVFSRFLEIPIDLGVVVGMIIVFFYATLGGMKGITWTQVAQYCVLICAFLIPAVAISLQLTGVAIPQIGFGSAVAEGDRAGVYLLQLIDDLHRELGFPEYTDGSMSKLNMIMLTVSLMVGTAGLPHVIIRFYTVKTVDAARMSAVWALLFIALLYSTAPAVALFARVNLIQTLSNTEYKTAPEWFGGWEDAGLLAWTDKNGDGRIQYLGPAQGGGNAFEGKPVFTLDDNGEKQRGSQGELVTSNPSDNANELYIDRDIMVLANPEIANLPAWVVGFVAAGGLAAALSTAAGLLMVISSAISHDLYKRVVKPDMGEKEELFIARIAAAVAVIGAGLLGIFPPGFVAQVVAFAFGLAASTFFPIIVLGVFSKRVNREGAIAGMVTGLVFTFTYIVLVKTGTTGTFIFGIAPEGIGSIGMVINFIVAIAVSSFTAPPPQEVQDLVTAVRDPRMDPNAAVMDH